MAILFLGESPIYTNWFLKIWTKQFFVQSWAEKHKALYLINQNDYIL